jgi:hypothetical protein
MASYFVASPAFTGGAQAVHDRSRCPPATFPPQGEYLGEYHDVAQALAVARLRYPHARACACCSGAVVRVSVETRVLTDVRS